jgi:uridine phosphorylase
MQVKVPDLAPKVLVVGDPARARRVAERLEDWRLVGENREYVTFTGQYKGATVSVASHGVGAAGAAAAFEELCRGGATTIIRVGTAGGTQPEVLTGHIVVANAAVRLDGLSDRLVPAQWPAVADLDLTLALRDKAQTSGLTAHVGTVLTVANFYPSPVLPSDTPMWQQAGAVAIEMEVAALLTVAGLNRVRAGAIVAIDGNPTEEQDESMAGYNPFQEVVAKAVDGAITVGLDALVEAA